jgi:predicted phage-related endonuclease
MGDVLAVLKNGKPAEARLNYMRQLVAERMTDTAAEFYVTAAMQWGLDYEAEAVAAYEELSGELCDPAPFVLHQEIEFFGATPDRYIGSDGLLEVKCPTTATYIEWLQAGEIPARHIAQMTAQLACTRRKWCDFVAYDPRIVYGPKLWVKRFEPSSGAIADCEVAARQFLAEVDALFRAVTEG